MAVDAELKKEDEINSALNNRLKEEKQEGGLTVTPTPAESTVHSFSGTLISPCNTHLSPSNLTGSVASPGAILTPAQRKPA